MVDERNSEKNRTFGSKEKGDSVAQSVDWLTCSWIMVAKICQAYLGYRFISETWRSKLEYMYVYRNSLGGFNMVIVWDTLTSPNFICLCACVSV